MGKTRSSKTFAGKEKRKASNSIPAYKDQGIGGYRPERTLGKIYPAWMDISKSRPLGRIKRKARELLYPNGVIRKLPEKIILPRVAKSPNKYMRDHVYQLHAHLCLEGRKYHLPIRRLVYHCFVKPFPLDDQTICIVSRQGNGLDISPDNLEMIRRVDQTARIYSKRRMVSIFQQERYREMGKVASMRKSGRQVSQYDTKGKKIKTFSSISEAARSLGTTSAQINNVVNELEPTAAGFYWRSGNEKRFDVKAFLEKRRQGYKEKRGRRVTQYDKEGKPIGHYISLQDAGKAVNGHWTAISGVIRGVKKTAYGYRWKSGHHKRKMKPLK